MSGSKRLYMMVLYNCKNKETVDNMTWDELCAYAYLMAEEVKNRE